MANTQEAHHVTVANNHTRKLFDWLLKNRTTMEKAFDLPMESIDLDLAFQTFDPLAYNAAFAATEGDVTLLNSPYMADTILEQVMEEWPERYFLEHCVKRGLSYKFDTADGGAVYVIKEDHKEEVKTMLKASAINPGV